MSTPLQYRVVTPGVGHGYHVIAFPASYGDVDVRQVPDRVKVAVAGPYTSRDAAQTRASQENWRKS